MVAFNAVAPFLILLGIGFAAVRLKWADRAFMDKVNAFNYKLFFPFLMFNNVYSANPENMPSVKLMLTGFLSVSLLVVLLVIIVPKFVKENPRRGVVIQGIFRSNFIIYGIPLTTYVFGAEKSSVCGMMIMIMVSLFNVAAVIVLEMFREGGKISAKKLLLGIVKNPLLQGCVAGLLFYLLQIRLPSFIASPVSSLAGVATTLALVVLLALALLLFICILVSDVSALCSGGYRIGRLNSGIASLEETNTHLQEKLYWERDRWVLPRSADSADAERTVILSLAPQP